MTPQMELMRALLLIAAVIFIIGVLLGYHIK